MTPNAERLLDFVHSRPGLFGIMVLHALLVSILP